MRIGQAAKLAGITPNTVRTYLKKFPESFSSSAISQTGKDFTQRDLETLKHIKTLLQSGLTYADVAEYPPQLPDVLDPEELHYNGEPGSPLQQDNALALPEVFEFIQQALDSRDQQHQREIDAKNETIALLREELERARLPWWRRLF